MQFKDFWKSKLFWVGLLSCFIAVGNLVAEFLQSAKFTPDSFVLLGVGVATVILRIFYTDTVINR